MRHPPLALQIAGLWLALGFGILGCRDADRDRLSAPQVPRGVAAESQAHDSADLRGRCRQYLRRLDKTMLTLGINPQTSAEDLLEAHEPRSTGSSRIRKALGTLADPPPGEEITRMHRELMAALHDLAETIEQIAQRNASESTVRLNNCVGNIRHSLQRIEATCALLSR